MRGSSLNQALQTSSRGGSSGSCPPPWLTCQRRPPAAGCAAPPRLPARRRMRRPAGEQCELLTALAAAPAWQWLALRAASSLQRRQLPRAAAVSTLPPVRYARTKRRTASPAAHAAACCIASTAVQSAWPHAALLLSQARRATQGVPGGPAGGPAAAVPAPWPAALRPSAPPPPASRQTRHKALPAVPAAPLPTKQPFWQLGNLPPAASWRGGRAGGTAASAASSGSRCAAAAGTGSGWINQASMAMCTAPPSGH